jgi:aspartate-semialdehyde dehydrogenase
VIIVGATGRVGREMLSILAENRIPAENISLAASSRSAGSVLKYMGSNLEVADLSAMNFADYEIGLFSAGREISCKYAPIANEAGCVVIDNTSYFRMFDDVPLIVPEVNLADLEKYNNKKLIANPNCSTIQMVMALKPLHDLFGLKEIVASTYQATSGAGQKGVDELMSQTAIVMSAKNVTPSHFKKQIAFNVIPQIDSFADCSYTKEELKMMNETKKILEIQDVKITATCVRVPVVVGHCVSVFVRFQNRVDLESAKTSLDEFNGVKVIDDPQNFEFATPIDAVSKDDVFVSRIRKHPADDYALSFWCVGDNLRKGAALNAIQIASVIS